MGVGAVKPAALTARALPACNRASKKVIFADLATWPPPVSPYVSPLPPARDFGNVGTVSRENTFHRACRRGAAGSRRLDSDFLNLC